MNKGWAHAIINDSTTEPGICCIFRYTEVEGKCRCGNTRLKKLNSSSRNFLWRSKFFLGNREKVNLTVFYGDSSTLRALTYVGKTSTDSK